MSVARRAGIPIDKTRPVGVSTANGVARGWPVKINRIRVGEITLYQVEALVMEDESLGEPLLGMSFLNRTQMKRDGDQMTLRVRY
jgi:aspartyl protease family protein